ncbi:hypothetical protein pb186bvf_015858 [Paramecium bursaria]
MDFSEIFTGVTQAQYSPCGNYIVLQCANKLAIKDTRTLNQIPFTYSSFPDSNIHQVQISPNGSLIAISYPKRNYIEIRKIDEPNWISKIDEQAGIESIQWAPDNVSLIVVSQFQVNILNQFQKQLKASIFNLSNRTIVHLQNPKQMAFSECGKFMAFIERKQAKDIISILSVKEWKIHSTHLLDTLDSVQVIWQKNTNLIAIVDTELNHKLLLFCQYKGIVLRFESNSYTLGVKSAQFANNTDIIAIAYHDEKVRLVNTVSLIQITEFDHKYQNKALILKEIASQQDQLHQYQEIEGGRFNVKQDKGSVVSLMEWSHNDEFLATKCENYPTIIFVWQISTLFLKYVLIHLTPVKSFKWSKVQTTLAIATGQSRVLFWNPEQSGICELPFDTKFNVQKVEWSLDQQSILLCDKNDLIIGFPNQDEIFYIFLIWCFYAIYFARAQINKITRPHLLKEHPDQWKPFQRHSIDKLRRWEVYLGTIFLMPIRVLCCYTILAFCLLFLWVIQLPMKRDQPFNKFIWFFHRLAVKIVSRIVLWFHGFISIEVKHVDYKTFDPDYLQPLELKNASPTIVVSNHVSNNDTFVGCFLFQASFLAKAEIDKQILIGDLARMFKSIFVQRESQENRNHALEQIQQRVDQINAGQLYPPIMIFPEGTGTNGRYLLNFKKGAFEGMNPIKIIALKYEDRHFSYYDQIGLCGIMIGMSQIYSKLTIYEFNGLYKPNVQTWEEFAEKTRDIISKCIGATKTQSGYRESKQYYTEYF